MHIYFLGIGGAGIGPLAQIAYQAGYQVSGSDQQNSSYIDYLKKQGIVDIEVSSFSDIVKNVHQKKPIDWVVYSSAVSMSKLGRSQIDVANSLGIKCSKRDQFISQFLIDKNLQMIAVAGTHGKTTTTAMIVWLFKSLNKPVSYLIPAKVSFGEMGSYSQDSKYFVYEADEFDHNFLSFNPTLSVISGVSWDHHEIYPTREAYIDAFNQFISKSQSTVIWASDAKYLNAVGNLQVQEENNEKLSDLTLKGLYNRRDGWLALASVSHLLNIPIQALTTHINNFPGLSRRMEEIYPDLFSDYAHTPEKIIGAMSVATEIAKARAKPLIVIYEPLTNRRQIYIKNEYKNCFNGATHVYWLPSYLAREDPKDEIIKPAELINKLSDPSIAEPAERNDQLVNIIHDHLNQGYMVVAMAGGGGNSLDDWLREKFKTNPEF